MSATAVDQWEFSGASEGGRVWPAWAVPAAAVGEWVDLQLAIAAAGRAPVCRQDPEAWWSAGASVEQAVEACSWCPVLGECRAYALAAGERYGVWGGLTPAERRAAVVGS